jgi:V/A-type H+-transporting ATPase subunit C
VARLDYANARLGARRARLLGAAGLREVLAQATLEARIDLLRGLPLGALLPPAPGPDPLAAVEAALREAWRREAAAVLHDAEGTRARALLAAFLGLDEAQAVKAVLRGAAQGLAADRTLAAAPPVPGLDEAALRIAASAGGLEAAIEALAGAGSALAAPVREALPLRGERGLLPLEIAADRAAFERARLACRGGGEDAPLLLRHVEDRIDARNAATLLALAGAPPTGDAFIEGGRRIAGSELRRLAVAGAAELRGALARAFRATAAELASPWSADRALERALLAPLRREARLRPLSIAVPLAYLAERRSEVRRVALVLRGVALGLGGEEILELVEP